MLIRRPSAFSILEMRNLVRNSGPLSAIYAADIAMYLTDMVIVGRLGIPHLAGVAISEQIVFLAIAVLGSFISLISVSVSNAYGAGDMKRSVHVLKQGILIVVLISLPATFLAFHIDFALRIFGVDSDIATYAGSYGKAVAWCVTPYLIFMLLRGFMAAIDRSHSIIRITVLAVLINAPLSYVLTFGFGSFSGFGVAGAGVSTSLVTWMMAIVVMRSIIRNPPLPDMKLFGSLLKFDRGLWGHIFKNGTPAAFTAILEDGLFTITGIIIATFGSIALAAHYVANGVVNVAIVFANGIGDATAIRVANHRGANSLEGVKISGFCGIALCIFVMFLFSAIILIFPENISGIFIGTDDVDFAQVVSLSAQLFIVAAFSQVIEGIQIVSTRALRGLEDTLVPMIIALFSYWLLALPLGLFLAIFLDFGVIGMWLGLASGLTFAAIFLVLRFYHFVMYPELGSLMASNDANSSSQSL